MDSPTLKTKVLVIEDSKVMQKILAEFIASDKDIEIVGFAQDPYEARELIKTTNPDVITLDIMMPQMDGITFLKHLMRLRPTPVLMLSSFTSQGSTVTVEAMANGAVACLPKPTASDLSQPDRYAQTLVKTIKEISQAQVHPASSTEAAKKLENYTLVPILIDSPLLRREIIAIGGALGGVEALKQLLEELPQVLPPILIAQRFKNESTAEFVRRLNKDSSLSVVEAMNSQQLFPAHVYVAPPGRHFTIKKKNSNYYCFLEDGEAGSGHLPSIDRLFQSVAQEAQENSMGILLTGEGEDGARGMKAIKEAGGVTMAQDQQTSISWEMPGAAVREGAVNYVLSLEDIPRKILGTLDEKNKTLPS